MKKVIIIADKNKKSLNIKKRIKKLNLNNPFNESQLIIVIGGDGFMLKVLKKDKNVKNLYYGINSGNYGFLMNKFSLKNLRKKLFKKKKISISPLFMKVVTSKNIVKKSLAINEVYVLRQSKQASFLSIKANNKLIIKKLVGDGVLVSTPAGSTAYNLSVHGPILNLHSKKISISPISPFRPRRWRGKILQDTLTINIKNLDTKKRPILSVADNYEVKNAKMITIKTLKNVKFNLLYDHNQSLQNKIKLEQLRKEIN